MYRGEDCKNCVSSSFDGDLYEFETLIKCFNSKAFPPNLYLRSTYIIKNICKFKEIIVIQSKLKGVVKIEDNIL